MINSQVLSFIGKLDLIEDIVMEEYSQQIIVAKEFSECPGARSKKDGDFSGEEFLNDILIPKFEKVKDIKNALLLVDLDNVEGYATSFLEAAFGGLARIYLREEIMDHLRFKCNDEPLLEREIKQYIQDARKK